MKNSERNLIRCLVEVLQMSESGEKLVRKYVGYCPYCNWIWELKGDDFNLYGVNDQLKVYDVNGKLIDHTDYLSEDVTWVGDLYLEGNTYILRLHHEVEEVDEDG